MCPHRNWRRSGWPSRYWTRDGQISGQCSAINSLGAVAFSLRLKRPIQPEPVRSAEAERGRKVSQGPELEIGFVRHVEPNTIGIKMPHKTFSASGMRRSLEEASSLRARRISQLSRSNVYCLRAPIPANFLLNLATWPPVSTMRCCPVHAG